MFANRRFLLLLPFFLILTLVLSGGCAANRIARAISRAEAASQSASRSDEVIVIPSGPEAFTQKKFWQISLQYHRRMIPQAYQQSGVKNPSWDKPALALLEKYAESRSYLAKPAELTPLARPLLKSGCTDPMVNYAIGVALMNENRNSEAEPFVRQAVNGFTAGKYSRAVVWSAPLRLADIYLKKGGLDNEVASLKTIGIRWLGEGAAKANFRTRETPVFWDMLTWYLNDSLKGHLPEIYQAVKSHPESDPWLVDLIGGRYEIKEAWKSRGGGWAKDVTKEGWQGFHEHLAKARELLTQAWKMHPDYPEPADEMITVVMGEGAKPGDTERVWFNRAVAAQMDFEPAYDSLARALMPRWGGSQEEMYQFGLDCLATKRFDTPVPLWYYHMVFRISDDDHGGDAKIWQRPEVYDNLRLLYQGMLADPSLAGEQNWIKSFWAVLNWRCGKYQEAGRLIDELGKNFQADEFRNQFDVDPEKALAEISAGRGGKKGR